MEREDLRERFTQMLMNEEATRRKIDEILSRIEKLEGKKKDPLEVFASIGAALFVAFLLVMMIVGWISN